MEQRTPYRPHFCHQATPWKIEVLESQFDKTNTVEYLFGFSIVFWRRTWSIERQEVLLFDADFGALKAEKLWIRWPNTMTLLVIKNSSYYLSNGGILDAQFLECIQKHGPIEYKNYHIMVEDS